MYLPLTVTVLLARCVFAISLSQLDRTNCSTGSIPCGPGSACCPSGYICNFRRGIPACENLQYPLISGWGGPACADPYLYDCSSLVGIQDKCCPIGTVCFNDGVHGDVTCIDAYGTTSASYPSATTGVVPAATLVPDSDPNIQYNPPSAWNNSNTVPNCTSGNTLHVSSTINATVSFNYTGPSVIVHTVTSSLGGVFSVFADGVDTQEILDTFSGGLPLCYPVQYPPFRFPPPTLGTQNNHWITLMYTGPSTKAPNGTQSSNVQFNSFAIPEFSSSTTSSNNAMGINKSGLAIVFWTVVVGCMFGVV